LTIAVTWLSEQRVIESPGTVLQFVLEVRVLVGRPNCPLVVECAAEGARRSEDRQWDGRCHRSDHCDEEELASRESSKHVASHSM
jgi:hypothetical protein